MTGNDKLSPLGSLIKTGTKLWLDSIEPTLIESNQKLGATGATSNPIIVANILKQESYKNRIKKLKTEGLTATDIAWHLTDELVSDAEKIFLPIWKETKGNDGFVSFELDPLLEDINCTLSIEEKIKEYVRLGLHWSANHPNRLIKIPATEAGLGALEELVAKGVNVNVTLIFTERQYKLARDFVWAGAQKRHELKLFKSVFSIFVSRLDVYTEQNLPDLSPEAQGLVGIVNAKKIWKQNKSFWEKQDTPLEQEMIFASTGTKKASDPAWKYVAAFAGSDIETNPPETNYAIENQPNLTFEKKIDTMPAESIVMEIEAKVDWQELEKDLMSEGLIKFAQPQKELVQMIEQLI